MWARCHLGHQWSRQSKTLVVSLSDSLFVFSSSFLRVFVSSFVSTHVRVCACTTMLACLAFFRLLHSAINKPGGRSFFLFFIFLKKKKSTEWPSCDAEWRELRFLFYFYYLMFEKCFHFFRVLRFAFCVPICPSCPFWVDCCCRFFFFI
jgi:hypothetical protein